MSDRQAFWSAVLRECSTQPMTASELAGAFGLSRRKMAAVLERMPGAERSGYFWTVPLRRMPPGWLAKQADRLCEFVADPSEEDSRAKSPLG